MIQREYEIRCPHCGQGVLLFESTLDEMLGRRKAPTTGTPFITLVCQDCRTAFPFDYPKRQPVGTTDVLLQDGGLIFFFVARCNDSNCKSGVELFALRPRGTTMEQVGAEIPTWKLNGI